MNSREKYILQALQQTGSISLSELSSTLGVSLVTIRKDVANLEAKE
ncbi:DeoR family transcriptional regulator, partial [Hungatella effluvii]